MPEERVGRRQQQQELRPGLASTVRHAQLPDQLKAKWVTCNPATRGSPGNRGALLLLQQCAAWLRGGKHNSAARRAGGAQVVSLHLAAALPPTMTLRSGDVVH